MFHHCDLLLSAVVVGPVVVVVVVEVLVVVVCPIVLFDVRHLFFSPRRSRKKNEEAMTYLN